MCGVNIIPFFCGQGTIYVVARVELTRDWAPGLLLAPRTVEWLVRQIKKQAVYYSLMCILVQFYK